MLSKMDIVVDKDAFEEILENALTDMEETETDVRNRIRRAIHLYLKMHFISLNWRVAAHLSEQVEILLDF